MDHEEATERLNSLVSRTSSGAAAADDRDGLAIQWLLAENRTLLESAHRVCLQTLSRILAGLSETVLAEGG